MPIAHAQFTVTTLCLYMMIAFEVLTESLSIQHLVAQTARRNSYQPVLVHIYRNCAIVQFMRSKKLTNKKQKVFSEKQKGFRDDLSFSTPQKSEGNAITQPWSHPIPKFYILLMGTHSVTNL